MSRKNRWRLILYFPLACVVLMVLTHPYFRQTLLGPRIQGEPFWYWQQEARFMADPDSFRKNWMAQVLEWAKIKSTGNGMWGGSQPTNDQDAYRVWRTLTGDASAKVRARVASRLRETSSDENFRDALEAIVALSKDEDADVRLHAISSLDVFCHRRAATLMDPAVVARLQELMQDTSVRCRVAAAGILLGNNDHAQRAVALLKSEFESTNALDVRHQTVRHLANAAKGYPEAFDFVKSIARDNDRSLSIRQTAVFYLGDVGEKALPELLYHANNGIADMRIAAVYAISRAHQHAKPAIPKLLQLRDNDPSRNVRLAAEETLHLIDPMAFPAREKKE